MANWIVPFAVDLQKPAPEPRFVQTLMVPGDDEAHVIQVTVNDGGVEATLTGSAMGYFTRIDGLTVRCAGTVSGNVVSVSLASECYAYPGRLRCVIRLLTDVENELGTSLIDMDFVIRAGFGDEMIDPGEAFPTVHALATEIEDFVSTTNGRLNALEDAPALIQELTLAEGWENYSSSDTAPRVVRKGSICFLQGRIKNTATITLDVSNTVTVATLPNWAYPAVRAGFIEQGSSTNIFLVDIMPDGKVNLSRYRTTTYTEITSGAMFYLTAAWLPSDATGETVDDLEALIARMEAASVGGVRYDQAQSLTTAQKAQARANIGVNGLIQEDTSGLIINM